MEIKKVTDAAFRKYGRVVDNVDFTALVAELEKTPCTQEVVYEPSVEQLEALPVYKELQDTAYGEMPIQIGFCNGNNYKLNALEYHRSSEIDVAASDLILLLGWQQDIEEGYTYDTSKVEAFLLPRVWAWSFMQQHFTMRPATARRKASAVLSFSPTEPICRWMRTTVQAARMR